MNTNKDNLAQLGIEPTVICKIDQTFVTDSPTTDIFTTDEISTDVTFTMFTGIEVTGENDCIT